MKLKCDLIIQNLNNNNPSSLVQSNQLLNQQKLHKGATIGLYRPKLEDEDDQENWSSLSTDKKTIILTIETKTINLKYKLKRIETNTKFINEGKASLKLVDENVYLLISNTPSLTLINFISFLRVKMAKSSSLVQQNSKNQTINNNKENKFVNKLLNNVQCTLPMNSLSTISPLCEKELNDVLNNKNLKGKLSNDSPITSRVKKPLQPLSNNINKSLSQPCKETPNKSKLPRCASSTSNFIVQLTDEQKYVLKAIKDGNNVFFTGPGGVGKSFLINLIKKSLPNDSCFVTASTGVAASLIGGITLHAFAGVGTQSNYVDDSRFKKYNSNNNLENKEDTSQQKEEEEEDNKEQKRLHAALDRILKSKEKVNNWKKCQHLIIDEISSCKKK
jgi:hypothetical protein